MMTIVTAFNEVCDEEGSGLERALSRGSVLPSPASVVMLPRVWIVLRVRSARIDTCLGRRSVGGIALHSQCTLLFADLEGDEFVG